MNTTIAVALLSMFAAIAGVIVSKLWDTLHDRRRGDSQVETARIVDAGKVREELWAELLRLRERIDDVETALHESRKEYIDLLAAHTDLQEEHRQLKRAHDELQGRHDELQSRYDQQVEHLRQIPEL